ncbi:MAG TPA: PEGA domain-containing protein, partial [Anaeromyxobacteraceae bacterium]|nr:PEGA domain-containing protein [Anaeromyxobacteraceae bacterium]
PAPQPVPAKRRTAIAKGKPAPVTRTVARPAAASGPLEIGWLDVDAPDEAEVFVDGRRVGRGQVRRHQLTEGTHRVEVRLGDARTGETFTVGPRETYTYEVHQTAQ